MLDLKWLYGKWMVWLRSFLPDHFLFQDAAYGVNARGGKLGSTDFRGARRLGRSVDLAGKREV